MHLTERYKRPDLGHLNVELTIDDAKAFTKPYSFTRSFTLAPGLAKRLLPDRYIGIFAEKARPGS